MLGTDSVDIYWFVLQDSPPSEFGVRLFVERDMVERRQVEPHSMETCLEEFIFNTNKYMAGCSLTTMLFIFHFYYLWCL